LFAVEVHCQYRFLDTVVVDPIQRMTTPATATAEIEGMEAVRDYDDAANDEHLTEAEKSMRDEELSFYSNSTNDYGDDNIWGLLSGIGGNIYEWYVFLYQTSFVSSR
jgi:hypothetical protein